MIDDKGQVPTKWIDPALPFDLVEATVAIRDAFVRIGGDTGTWGNCWVAAALLGTRARDLGYQAEWESAALHNVSFHMLVGVGRWMFDPTAEQIGFPGPVAFERPNWDLFYAELAPGPESEVSEFWGISGEIPPLTEARLLEHLYEFSPDSGRALLQAAELHRLAPTFEEEVRAMESERQ